MNKSMLTGLALAATTTMQATPAHACLFHIPDFTERAVAFENKTVPLNATLASVLLRPGGEDATISLIGPDGVARTATFASDEERGLDRIIPDAPLIAGSWMATITGMNDNGERVTRDVAFTVADVVDTDPPPPPRITFVRHTEGVLFANDCQAQWPRTNLIGSLDGDTDYAELALLENEGLPRVVDDDTVIFLGSEYNEADIDFDFVAIDFAGNRSDIGTAVEVGGCGCSSNDAPVFASGLAALGMLALRRRRHLIRGARS